MTGVEECDNTQPHWHCPMCLSVYVISERLLATRGELYANRTLNYYRDQHITEHCEEFAEEMELADL